MAGNQLTDTYLAQLARSLPTDTVDELADGLAETYQRHLDRGRPPDAAAAAAIAEFGSTEEITTAFTQAAPGRRVARLLLATGPAVGACWAASLLTARFWTWPTPTAAIIAGGAMLLTVVALLIAAATSRRSYRRTKIAAIGSVGMILLDLGMPATILLLTPTLAWPMAAAIPASLLRAGLTLRSLPTIVFR